MASNELNERCACDLGVFVLNVLYCNGERGGRKTACSESRNGQLLFATQITCPYVKLETEFDRLRNHKKLNEFRIDYDELHLIRNMIRRA